MQVVDVILTNGTVVTMDSSYTLIEDGAIAIKGDSIVDVGSAKQIMQRYQADEVLDCAGKIIMPGLVNAHTHAAMTLLRGMADDLRLDVWLIGFMMPTEREFVTPEFVDLGTRLACAEMICSGVTTFNDMYYFEDSVAEAAADIGMRAICGQTILKFPSPDADSYEHSLEACRQFIMKWKGHPLIVPSVAPHAPYTATPEMLQACKDLAREFNVPLHIHISETPFEVKNSREEHEMPVVPWVKKLGLFEAKVIAAHCVHVDKGEIYTLHHNGVGVAHCPTSNLKLASGIAPVKDMLEIGLNVGIGTDGPASNNDLDMFEETRLAAIVTKTAADMPTVLPARQALAMATRIGAQALHIGHLTGSIEAGKRADIVVLDLRKLHNWPYFQYDDNAVYSRIVYASKSTDVQYVMCNGRWLLRDYALQTVDTDVLFEQAAETAQRIDAFLRQREGSALSRLLALGGMEREESFEVQVKARVASPLAVDALLERPDVVVIKHSHYRQHDTYFEFGVPANERVRYREDDMLDESGMITSVRTRLTLMSGTKEHEFEDGILLSRSRFISAASYPLRFYKEYFRAATEKQVVKDRLRWQIEYQGMRLYVNVDQLLEPDQPGYYLEIKSRTWSLTDAEQKARALSEILEFLNIEKRDLVMQEYISIAAQLA